MSTRPELDDTGLDRTLSDLTAALGDPTRRGIYLFARESAAGVTATEVAENFGIHANVARHHLERLVEGRYLRVRKGSRRPGAGRPAKCYEATDKEITLHYPDRRYDLLVELLVRVLDRVAEEGLAEVAESIGREYGAELAEAMAPPDDSGYEGAVRTVARAMTGLGFAVDADVENQRLLMTHCPFGDAATGHPEVVCSIDQGIVAGMMEALDQSCQPVVTPHTRLADDCVTFVPLSISSPD